MLEESPGNHHAALFVEVGLGGAGEEEALDLARPLAERIQRGESRLDESIPIRTTVGEQAPVEAARDDDPSANSWRNLAGRVRRFLSSMVCSCSPRSIWMRVWGQALSHFAPQFPTCQPDRHFLVPLACSVATAVRRLGGSGRGRRSAPRAYSASGGGAPAAEPRTSARPQTRRRRRNVLDLARGRNRPAKGPPRLRPAAEMARRRDDEPGRRVERVRLVALARVEALPTSASSSTRAARRVGSSREVATRVRAARPAAKRVAAHEVDAVPSRRARPRAAASSACGGSASRRAP